MLSSLTLTNEPRAGASVFKEIRTVWRYVAGFRIIPDVQAVGTSIFPLNVVLIEIIMDVGRPGTL